MQKLFKIGEVSRLYHIGVDSLRYYEEIGLICPKRTESGYRLYSEREIWRLNVIRDLRDLGFPMESIRKYLEFQNVDTALGLLDEEKNAIREKMKTLQKLRENVEKRMETIRVAQQMPLHQIVLKEFPDRNCYRMEAAYQHEHEMDVLIEELLNRSGRRLYIIGNNQFGSLIPRDCVLENVAPRYKGVFLIDPKGDSRIPAGRFLCVCYKGTYDQTALWLGRLSQYAKEHGYSFCSDALEMLWIDGHTTKDPEEYITELQVPVT